MRFLPIVERELRVASRRPLTYWVRSAVALTVILLMAWLFLVSFRETPRELARILFYVLTGGALLFCLAAGLRSTADCISEEKREGTLGLLFLTDLKGYDVVLGKLTANSLTAFYALLAIVPMLAIPLLLGGVAPEEFARVSLVLINTLFFSMSLGMFASACNRSMRNSIATTMFLLLIFTAGIPAWGAWLASRQQWTTFENVFFLPSPIYAYVTALEGPMRVVTTGFIEFYWSLLTIHALGWLFLALASVFVPRSWQDRPAGVGGERLRRLWHFWSHGTPEDKLVFRKRLLDQNAFLWLAARARMKPLWVWLMLITAAGGWIWGWLKFKEDWLYEGMFLITAFLLNSVLKNWVAAEAVSQLRDDRQMGTLELILSTPLTIKDILRGQALALKRQFLLPLVVVVLAEIWMLLYTGGRGVLPYSERRIWLWIWIAGIVMLIADLVALYWVGMWLGVASKNPKRAYSDTVGRVLAIPWLAFVGFLTLVSVFSLLMRTSEELPWQLFLGVWVALGLGVDLGLGMWARHKLLTEFREMATRRFEQRLSWWRRLLGVGQNKA